MNKKILRIRLSLMFLSISSCFVIFVSSCKKKDHAPLININSPYENSTFKNMDTIPLQLMVSDDRKVENVVISLYKSDNNAPIGSSIIITVNKKEDEIYTDFIINEPTLPAGSYYLKAQAFDGKQYGNDYVYINIQSTPRQFKKAYFLNKSYNDITVYECDNYYNINQVHTSSGDLLKMVGNSMSQQWLILGEYTRNMQCFDANTNQQIWSENIISNYPDYYWTDVYASGNNYYVAFRQGIIRKYSHDGAQIQTLFCSQDYYPVLVYADDEWVLAVEKQNNGTQQRLIIFYAGSGAKYNVSTPLPDKPVGIFKMGDKHYTIVTNSGNLNYFYQYNPDNNLLTIKKTLGGGPITDADGGNGEIYCLMNNNLIIKVDDQYQSSNFVSSITNNFFSIAYDQPGQRLFVGNDYGFTVYSTTTKQKLHINNYYPTFDDVVILNNY